jgi:heme/copper-type cytochrome/quinol oxidase subunit 2
MYYLAATLHTRRPDARHRHPQGDQDPERGSVTIENVIWAVAVIAIVGIVVLAITNYVRNKAAEIR